MPGGRPPADLVVVSPVWTEPKKLTTKRALRMLREEFTNALCTTSHGPECYCFECVVKEPTLLKQSPHVTFLSPGPIGKTALAAPSIPPCALCGDEVVHKVWL